MARVAANQDRSVALRKEYIYKQQIRIFTHKHGGKLMREETADYDVVPTPDGTEKKSRCWPGTPRTKEGMSSLRASQRRRKTALTAI